MCVQKLVSLMASGFCQKFFIQKFNIGVLVALADCRALILAVQSARTQFLDILCHLNPRGNDRLSAARYTAAGACHNLDKVIVRLSVTDAFEQGSRVAESVSDCGFDL